MLTANTGMSKYNEVENGTKSIKTQSMILGERKWSKLKSSHIECNFTLFHSFTFFHSFIYLILILYFQIV